MFCDGILFCLVYVCCSSNVPCLLTNVILTLVGRACRDLLVIDGEPFRVLYVSGYRPHGLCSSAGILIVSDDGIDGRYPVLNVTWSREPIAALRSVRGTWRSYQSRVSPLGEQVPDESGLPGWKFSNQPG